MYNKFWFHGDLFEIWMPVCSRVPVALLPRIFFFSWQNGTLLSSLGLFFFPTQGLFSAFEFSWAKIFPQVKSFHVWILSSGQCKHNIQIKWRGKVTKKIPRGGSPWFEIMTPSWFLNFCLKICFSKQPRHYCRFLIFLQKHWVNYLTSIWSNKRKNYFFGIWRWNITLK